MLQENNFRDQIFIVMKQISGSLTAEFFVDYKPSNGKLVSSSQGFCLINQIKGTPAYWKKVQQELLLLIKQLRCSIFFNPIFC